MRIETLASVMHKNDTSSFEQMNLCNDLVVINQSDFDKKTISKTSNGKRILFVSNQERGLSRSRNAAIDNATADICVIADDGFIHIDGIDKIIEEAYRTYPDADIITFQFIREGNRAKNYPIQPYKHNRFSIMKVSSGEVTFKLESINRVCVKFDEDFGTGSTFSHGEENIFLSDCLKRGLNIYYVPVVIGSRSASENTWFKGYDKKFLQDTGALYYVMGGVLWPVYNLQFALRKHKLYKENLSFLSALINMYKGVLKYKKLKKSKRSFSSNG